MARVPAQSAMDKQGILSTRSSEYDMDDMYCNCMMYTVQDDAFPCDYES